jgi:MFS family permease
MLLALTRYRSVLRHPGFAWLLGWSLVGRLPMGMVGLAIILAVTSGSGTYARAGLVSAAYIAGAGVTAPLVGRLVDRVGRRRVLLPLAIVYVGLVAGLAAKVGAGAWWQLTVAALAGGCQPPIASAVRSLWPTLLDGEQRDTAFALEATLQELVFIAGPAVVAVLAAAAGPRWPLVACGLLALVGVAAFVRHPAAAGRGSSTDASAARGLLPVRELLLLAVSAGLLVVSLSVVEVSTIAFVSGRRASPAAAVILALWSAGSMLGGILYGARGRTGSHRLSAMFLAAAASFAVLAAATGPVTLAVLLFAGGMTIAPLLARVYGLVGEIAPRAAATEAFAWLATALTAGSAIGAALGGWLVEVPGPRAGFGSAALLTVLAAAVPLAVPRPNPSGSADVPGRIPTRNPP